MDKLNKIMKKFDIIHIVCADLRNGEVSRIGDKDKLAHDSLVSSLVRDFEAIKTLNESIEGKNLPQMWGQGEVECIVCKPTESIIITLFINQYRNTIEAYKWNKEVSEAISEIWKIQ